MADSTEGVTVRVPEWIADELEEIIKSYPRKQRPTRGDLLAKAWACAKSIPNSDNPEITQKGSGQSVDPAQKPKVNSGGEVQISIPEADAPWVQKLLKVRHSEKPGLPTALENNMLEFEWADRAYNELRKQKSPLVSIEAPGAGRRGAAPAEFPRTIGDREPGSGDPAPQGDLDPAIDAIKKTQRKRQAGTPDTARKTS